MGNKEPFMEEKKPASREPSTKCVALINGNEVSYDACGQDRNTASYQDWIYLGEGVVHSIGGVKQNSVTEHYFWKKP